MRTYAAHGLTADKRAALGCEGKSAAARPSLIVTACTGRSMAGMPGGVCGAGRPGGWSIRSERRWPDSVAGRTGSRQAGSESVKSGMASAPVTAAAQTRCRTDAEVRRRVAQISAAAVRAMVVLTVTSSATDCQLAEAGRERAEVEEQFHGRGSSSRHLVDQAGESVEVLVGELGVGRTQERGDGLGR